MPSLHIGCCAQQERSPPPPRLDVSRIAAEVVLAARADQSVAIDAVDDTRATLTAVERHRGGVVALREAWPLALGRNGSRVSVSVRVCRVGLWVGYWSTSW